MPPLADSEPSPMSDPLDLQLTKPTSKSARGTDANDGQQPIIPYFTQL